MLNLQCVQTNYGRNPESRLNGSLFLLQPHHGQPISKLAHLQRILAKLSIDRIQVGTDTNLLCRLETPCIDKRRHGRPHALHVIEEEVGS